MLTEFKINFSFFIICTFLLIIASCMQKEINVGSPLRTHESVLETSPKSPVLSEFDSLNAAWLNEYNSNSNDMGKFYLQNALILIENDLFIQGNKAISDYYSKKYANLKAIKSFKTDYIFHLKENLSMAYETGCIKTDSEKTYQYIVIWSNTNGKWLRELEAFAEKTIDSNKTDEIDTAREKWIKLANEHSSLNLSKSIYSDNFIYYNRGKIFQSIENLAKVYDYMNNPNYNVSLKKDICIIVQPDLAYEIGKWTATGNSSGSYIIIWNKLKNGEWKVKLDSNW